MKRIFFRLKLIGKLLCNLIILLLIPTILFVVFLCGYTSVFWLKLSLFLYIVYLLLSVFFKIFLFKQSSAQFTYTFYNPIDKNLKAEINKIFKKVYFKGAFQKRKKLDKIRFNNIRISFWSNAGAIFALGIALGSIVFTILYSTLAGSTNGTIESTHRLHNNDDIYVTIYSNSNLKNIDSVVGMTHVKNDTLIGKTNLQIQENPIKEDDNTLRYIYNTIDVNNKTIVNLLFSILITIVLLITCFPLFLRQIINKLPSSDYATISLSDLNRSEMLTFVSLRYWELCNDFTRTIIGCENSQEKKTIDDILDRLKKEKDRLTHLIGENERKINETIKHYVKNLKKSFTKDELSYEELGSFFGQEKIEKIQNEFNDIKVEECLKIILEKIEGFTVEKIAVILERKIDKNTSLKFISEIEQIKKKEIEKQKLVKDGEGKKRDNSYEDFFSNLDKDINKFRQNYTKKISNAKSLKLEVTRLLDILPIEFSHHITKFSPHIFEQRIYTLVHSLSTVKYIFENIKHPEIEKKSYCKELRKTIDEIHSIIYDIEYKRKKPLSQLIIFDEIHSYVIDMASITSTSKSLRIFTRGLSQLISKLGNDKNSDPHDFRYESIKYLKNTYEYDPFIALLHRSKSHYGFDLLITLENYYKKNLDLRVIEYQLLPKKLKDVYDNATSINKDELFLSLKKEKQKVALKTIVPKILYTIKNIYSSKNDKSKDDESNNNKVISKENLNKYIDSFKEPLKGIREDVASKHDAAMYTISGLFKEKFTKLINEKKNDSNIYILIFGYSSIVKRTLQNNNDLLSDNNVKIIVMKEDSHEMLDTRILRFELDSKNVRNTFTGSDDFIKRLLGEKDLLVMMAGAEAFDVTNQRLFHTNNYQKRVENLILFFNNNSNKPNPDLFVVAGNYKIYDKFPEPNNQEFGNEFFVDHYDKIDIYNFIDLKQRVTLITDDKEAEKKQNEINRRNKF